MGTCAIAGAALGINMGKAVVAQFDSIRVHFIYINIHGVSKMFLT
jgi:hypothetical protein